MSVIAINGSPRKGWNTHQMLSSALDGAKNAGYETELIHLSDLSFKGCTGCMTCKRKESTSLGVCALADDLKPVLRRIDTCDALILGSPLYFGEVTGMMRSCMERILFQTLSYDQMGATLREMNTPVLFVYTGNMPLAAVKGSEMQEKFLAYENVFRTFFGPGRTLLCMETLQIEDYSKYHMAGINEAERIKRHEEVFPEDCKRASELMVAMLNGTSDQIPNDLA